MNAQPGIRLGAITPISPLYYHKGPLISTPTVYLIWYGNWQQTNRIDNADGQQIVRDFLNAIGGSPYFAINSSLSTGSNVITGNVAFGGETTDTGSQGKILTDLKVGRVVTNAIVSGALPSDPSGVYFVLTSSDIVEASGFCTRFCGFHSHGVLSGTNIKYAFVGNPGRCLRGCAPQVLSPNGNAAVDGMVSIIAHELSEATTDPDGRTGWYDLRHSENADKCAWTYGRHQYRAANGAWANMGWDYLDGNGAFLYHRDFLIQRNTVRVITKTGMQVNYCATSYDPVTKTYLP
ncbi:MAG: hypothetical protein JWO95_1820 [Verrucomicrobiales bacterium]|nr:hypothetical protein [Verrucomicrobiales bacterium]